MNASRSARNPVAYYEVVESSACPIASAFRSRALPPSWWLPETTRSAGGVSVENHQDSLRMGKALQLIKVFPKSWAKNVDMRLFLIHGGFDTSGKFCIL
jgi:hypothetical protein